MAVLVFDEMYGELTFALRAAIRRYNVSPSDYDSLCDELGAENFDEKKRVIIEHSKDGMFSVFDWYDSMRAAAW